MVTMDEDGIPKVAPHDPLADHAEALRGLAAEVCRSPECERNLCDVLTASVKYARALLASLQAPADDPLAEAIMLAEARITNLIGSASVHREYRSGISLDVM